jgi:hypothetical protein
MSKSIKYGINITRGNLATTNIVSTSVTVGGIQVTDITVGNINFTGNLYQNGAVYVSGTGGGSGVSSQWTSTSGNLYYTTTAGNSFVGINTSAPTSALDVTGNARFTLGLTTGTIMATGLVSAGSINATTISSGNLVANNIRGANVTATNMNISAASAGSIVVTNSSITNETVTNINVSAANVGSLVVTDSNATNSTTTNLVATGIIIDNVNSTNITALGVSATNVTTSNMVATNSTISNIISTNVSVVNYTTANLISNNVSSANLNAVNITVSSMSIVNASAANVFTTDMVAGSTTTGNILSTNMVSTNATVSNVISTNLSATNVSASNILGSNLSSTNASIGNINATSVLATNAVITNVTVANIVSTNVATTNGTTTNLVATNATVGNVVSTNLSTTNVSTSSIVSTNVSTTNAAMTNATLNNLVSTSATLNNVVSTNINSTNMTANNLASTTATVGSILSSNIVSPNASIGSIFVYRGITASNMAITSAQNQSLMLANYGADGAWAIGANNTAMQYQVGGGGSGSHVFYTSSTTGQSNEAMGIERMRINGQGNVGVGTNNPGAKLHVVGNVLVNGLITTSNILATNVSVNSLVASGDSNRLGTIYTTGENVGINTATPVTKLHFEGYSDQMITLHRGPSDYYGFGAGNNTVYYMAGWSGRHAFYNNSSLGNKGTELMKVDENSKLTVTSVSTSNVNTGTLIASGLSSLQNVTATNISVNNIVITSEASLLSITTGNIDVSGDVRIKGDLYVTGSLTATNITAVNLIENNISTGTLVVSGVSSFKNLTTTNITSNTLAIYNSLTAGNVSVMTAFANITSGSEIGTVLGKDAGQYNALYTSYKHVGDANTQNYVHYDFNGAPDIFVINGQGRVGLSTTSPSNTLHVNGDLRVNGFITTPNLIASNVSTGTLIASGTSNLQNVTATNETLATLIATTGVTTASLLATGLVSAANLSATTATLPNLVVTNVTTSNLTATGTSVLQNVTATNISASTLTASGLSSLQNVTATNASVSTLTVSGLSTLQNVTATNETLSTLNVTGITTVNLLATGLVSAANLAVTAATLSNVVATNVTTSSLTAAGTSVLQNVTATNVSASTLTTSGLSALQNVTVTNVSASTLTASGLSNLQNITATNETLSTLNVTGITTANLLATGLVSVANLHATNTTLPNMNITNAAVSTLTVSGLSNLQNVTATNMTVSSVLSTLATTTNLISTNVTAGSMFIYNSATTGTVFASRALANITSGSRIGNILGKDTGIANALWSWYEHVGDFNSSNYVHHDFNGAVNTLVLNAQGRVGMGTTAPSNTLHVVGDMQVSSLITTGTLLATNITTSNLTLNSASISNGNLLLQNNNGGGVINFGTQDNAIWGRKNTGNATDYMQFRAVGNYEFWNGGFLGDQSPKMVITSVGNIGIGTTAPSNTLHVNGDVLVSGIITTSNLFATNITANGIVSLKSTRGILIGTSTDIDTGRLISALDSNMAANSYRFITLGQGATTNNQAELAFQYVGNGNPLNSFTLGIFGGEKMRIQANGNVGINTNNPTSTLQVNGSVSKTSGTFDIKHPLKENTRLVHSFVEGPRCDLIYRGRKQLVNGQAVVDINIECTHSTNGSMSPGTFEALCGNPQVFVGSNTTFEKVIGSVSGGQLTIQSNDAVSNTVIDWMIVAERIDPDIKTWNRTDADGYLVTEYALEE